MEQNYSIFKFIALGYGYGQDEDRDELTNDEIDQEARAWVKSGQNPNSYFDGGIV